MKIEIVRNLPSREYHAIRAASSSRLREIMRSPAHLRHMDENPKEGDALLVGDAFHTLVLEPERFEASFAVAPDVDRRTKEGKAAWAEFVESAAGRGVLTYDQHLMVTGMAAAVLRHATAGRLIRNRSETELTLRWTALGIPCKARIDAYVESSSAAFDLKSTEDASADAFARSVANFKYHVQAAWYLDALRSAGFGVETLIFIAVEKKEPYGVALYELDESAVEEGRIQIAKHLPILANCETTGHWPGYEIGVQSIALPKWSVKGEGVTL